NLLRNAYQQDRESDPSAKARYTQAMQSLAGGHGIFRLVLPLILSHGGSTDMSTGTPVGIRDSLPPAVPDLQGNIPEVRPESSFKPFMLLLLLVLAGLLLWLIITRTR